MNNPKEAAVKAVVSAVAEIAREIEPVDTAVASGIMLAILTNALGVAVAGHVRQMTTPEQVLPDAIGIAIRQFIERCSLKLGIAAEVTTICGERPRGGWHDPAH